MDAGARMLDEALELLPHHLRAADGSTECGLFDDRPYGRRLRFRQQLLTREAEGDTTFDLVRALGDVGCAHAENRAGVVFGLQ